MLPVTASPAAVTVIGHDSSCRAVVGGSPTRSQTRSWTSGTSHARRQQNYRDVGVVASTIHVTGAGAYRTILVKRLCSDKLMGFVRQADELRVFGHPGRDGRIVP